MWHMMGVWLGIFFLFSPLNSFASDKQSCSQTLSSKHRWSQLLITQVEFIPNKTFNSETADTKYRLESDPVILEVINRNRNALPNREFDSEVPGLFSAPILTPEEESSLFLRMNYLKFYVDLKCNQVINKKIKQSLPLLESMESALHEANEIRNQLYLVNTRLVKSVVSSVYKRIPGLQSRVDNPFSIGMKAVERAVGKFDVSLGFRFSTYATWAIRNALLRHNQQEVRLQQRFGSTVGDVLRDLVGGASDLDPEFEAIPWREVFEGLEERTQYILAKRFGLEGGGPCNLTDIAKELGLSKECVRQLLNRSLLQMKHLLLQRGFRSSDF